MPERNFEKNDAIFILGNSVEEYGLAYIKATVFNEKLNKEGTPDFEKQFIGFKFSRPLAVTQENGMNSISKHIWFDKKTLEDAAGMSLETAQKRYKKGDIELQ